jgi:hypothetical protein
MGEAGEMTGRQAMVMLGRSARLVPSAPVRRRPFSGARWAGRWLRLRAIGKTAATKTPRNARLLRHAATAPHVSEMARAMLLFSTGFNRK